MTHIWLRKMSTKEYEKEGSLQGCFICGSGMNLIILYPFPKSMKMSFGKKKPERKKLNWYSKFSPELKEEKGVWNLHWKEEQIKKYYLEGLLLHEIGHKMDSLYQRYWSKTYKRRAEKFANNFAYFWGDKLGKHF